MNDTDLIYIIFTMFTLNVIGIAGTWQGIDKITSRLNGFSERITTLEIEFKTHCKGGD